MNNTCSSSGKCLLCKGGLSDSFFNSKDFITNIEGIFHYKRCNTCGSYIQSPLPSQEYLNDCYRSHTQGYFQPLDEETLLSSYRSTEGSTIRRLLYNLLPRLKTIRLLPKHPAPAKVLEIGCSYGARLYNLFQMGYSVTGVELNEEMVNFARDRLKLDVRQGIVQNASFQDDSFDIIIMSMVLEHCLDPHGTIVKLKQWLRPGGELLISMPCCDGFEFRMYKANCYIVHSPYHIFLPSFSGISALLSPYFSIKEVGYQFFHRDLVASASFANSVENNILYRFIEGVGNVPLAKRIIRFMLLMLTAFGLRTSRISLRCRRR